MNNSSHDNLSTQLNELYLLGKLNNVVVFGQSEASDRIIRTLQSQYNMTSKVIDNNVSKQGMKFDDIIIEAPEDVLMPHDDSFIILIASKHYSSMAAQLDNLGYSGQYVQISTYDSFCMYSLSDETVQDKILRVRRGDNIRNEILNAHPDKNYLVCPYNALGDVYLAMGYACSYYHEANPEDIVSIVVGEPCMQVAELMGYRNIIKLNQQDMDELVQNIIFCEDKRFVIAHHDRPYTNVNIRISDIYPIPFDEHYPTAVFGLSGKCSIRRIDYVHKEFAKLIKGRTVILAPYAKSVIGIGEDYWKEKALEYSNKGFMVVTNVTDNQQPIQGTMPFFCDIVEFPAAVEYAGYFVGIRSGLCDIIRSVNCHEEIIYPEAVYSTTNMTVKEFFKL